MLFNSLEFLVFFPVVTILYYVIPPRFKHIWLLIASYFFYMCWNPEYSVLIALSTFITWLSGILISSVKTKKQKKLVVAGSFIINLSILVVFKYTGFIINNINSLLALLGAQPIVLGFDIILPVGISFYTFQALSYTVDVYRGDIDCERNILKYALFVSFFPQLVAGPIERSGNLLRQIERLDKKQKLDFDKMARGLTLMVFGLFMKMVVADRISNLVNTVFNSYWMYGGVELVLAAVGFAIQIYCDFSSYSTIAIGAAEVMGFSLMENFNTPYLARSVSDFWHRWHISLSTWFRDYLYIPLGGNRRGKLRKYFNIMVTFLVSGLWHGASWTFVVWGGLHGVYQVIGDATRPFKEKLNKRVHARTTTISYRALRVVITFILVDFAWIFFRSASIEDAFSYISRIFTAWDPWVFSQNVLYDMGLDMNEMNILLCALALLILVDFIRYYKNERFDAFLSRQCIWFRWGVIIALIFAVVIYGVYGPNIPAQAFIYFQF